MAFLGKNVDVAKNALRVLGMPAALTQFEMQVQDASLELSRRRSIVVRDHLGQRRICSGARGSCGTQREQEDSQTIWKLQDPSPKQNFSLRRC